MSKRLAARAILAAIILALLALLTVGVLTLAEARGWPLALAVFPGIPLAALAGVLVIAWASEHA